MKHLLIILTSFFFFAANAQHTGGGEGPSQIKSKSTGDHLYQAATTMVGFSKANGKFNTIDGATVGFDFTTGKTYYIKALKSYLPSGLGIGIDVSYLDMRLLFVDKDYSSAGLNFNIGVRAGLAVGYSFADNASVDMYYDLNPGIALYTDAGDTSPLEPRTSGYSIFDGMLKVFGFRLRFDNLTAGIEWQMGSLSFDGEYENNTSIVEYQNAIMHQNSLNIKIGKCF